MDQKDKETWIAALRSGKFVQAHKVLAAQVRVNGLPARCCIGVGYDVITSAHTENCHDSVDLEDRVSDPTETACRALGLTGAQQEKLVNMNDMEGKTFPEIADWIEANL